MFTVKIVRLVREHKDTRPTTVLWEFDQINVCPDPVQDRAVEIHGVSFKTDEAKVLGVGPDESVYITNDNNKTVYMREV